MTPSAGPITETGRHRVAVYGTLKQGERNHSLLRDAEFVGVGQLDNIVLYDLGPYPGARLEPSRGVEIEVYGVTASQFDRLDDLEGINPRARFQGLYHRRVLSTALGPAWVYLYNHSVRGCARIEVGGWSAADS